MGFLVSAPIHMSNKTNIFWSCFKQALKDNKKNQDGKRRVLSIIANDFTYQELQTNLNVSDYGKTDNIFIDITNILKINVSIELKVGEHTISESRKHANMCGYGAPPLSKPVITRSKLNDEQLKQFDLFFSDKENVNTKQRLKQDYLCYIYKILRVLYGKNFMKNIQMECSILHL